MVILKREPDNPQDTHAVAVLKEGQVVSHIHAIQPLFVQEEVIPFVVPLLECPITEFMAL